MNEGVKLDVNGYVRYKVDDPALIEAIQDYKRYEEIYNRMSSDIDKKTIGEYLKKATNNLKNILTYRLEANYGVEVLSLYESMAMEDVYNGKYFDLKIEELSGVEFDYGYNHLLKVTLKDDNLIKDFAKKDDELPECVIRCSSDIIGEVTPNRTPRELTEDEYRKIALHNVEGFWESNKLAYISDNEALDVKLDEINSTIKELKSKSHLLGFETPEGLYVVDIKLYDGEKYKDGHIQYDKLISEYYIFNKTGECSNAEKWDFLS